MVTISYFEKMTLAIWHHVVFSIYIQLSSNLWFLKDTKSKWFTLLGYFNAIHLITYHRGCHVCHLINQCILTLPFEDFLQSEDISFSCFFIGVHSWPVWMVSIWNVLQSNISRKQLLSPVLHMRCVKSHFIKKIYIPYW